MTILAQLEAVTNDFFLIKDGKAEDNYFETSFLLDYFLKQKRGIWKQPSGGKKISVPIRYDGNKAGFYVRNGTLSSTKTEAITAVNLPWIHAYGNATILRIDEMENAGPEAMISLVTEELIGAQESLRDKLATSLYSGTEGDLTALTGLNAVCNTTATTAYAGYSSNDIVSADTVTKVWTGKGTAVETELSLAAIKAIRTAAAYGKGKSSKPNFITTDETNHDKISEMLELQQRFTEGKESVKAGFTGIYYSGSEIVYDRYCPVKNLYATNSGHVGFAVHKKGEFKRTPWEFLQGTGRDKTLKIFFDGNFVCNNRRANYRHSNID